MKHFSLFSVTVPMLLYMIVTVQLWIHTHLSQQGLVKMKYPTISWLHLTVITTVQMYSLTISLSKELDWVTRFLMVHKVVNGDKIVVF
jgi:hypothetical protein